jgi:hypothetical protein
VIPFKIQEDESRHEPCPLVAVEKRLVLGDVKGVRGGHVRQVFVQVRFTKRSLWHCHRRFQQRLVADARGGAVSHNLLVVNLDNVLDGKEVRLGVHSASRRNVRS